MSDLRHDKLSKASSESWLEEQLRNVREGKFLSPSKAFPSLRSLEDKVSLWSLIQEERSWMEWMESLERSKVLIDSGEGVSDFRGRTESADWIMSRGLNVVHRFGTRYSWRLERDRIIFSISIFLFFGKRCGICFFPSSWESISLWIQYFLQYCENLAVFFFIS